MLYEEAQVYFRKYITKQCPECGKAPGELCDTQAVWVHYDRMAEALHE